MKKLLLALVIFTLALATLVSCGDTDVTTAETTTTEGNAVTTTTAGGNVTTTEPTSTTTGGTATTTKPVTTTAGGQTTTVKPAEPETPTEKTLVLDPETFQSYPAIVLNGVVPNSQYPNEFTFNKNGSTMTSSGITGITKIVAHVFGTYDNLKMYKGTSADGTLITPTVADKDLNKEYTYTFEGSTDEFFLTNPSDYGVHLYSLTIYYTGTVSDTAPENPDNSGDNSGGDTPTTPSTPSGAISVEEAIGIASGLSDEQGTTSDTYTLTGVITSVGEKEVVLTENGKSIICYMGTGTYSNLYMGYTVTLTGKIQNFHGTPELVYFTVDSYTAVKYTVSISIPDNGNVSASKTTNIAWGESVTITATADNGYELSALKVNGLKVSVTNGSYTLTVKEPVTVEATFVQAGTVAETLAKFDFGANGSATHNDGKDVSASKSYTSGNYTLTITNPTKLYDGAFDATGNSCLKLGTSKLTGSFTFTVPEDVKTVVVYVSGYKANSGKITVNGGSAMSITTHSKDGKYTAVEIDTSSVKTVTISTVTGALRVMIDTIEFKA